MENLDLSTTQEICQFLNLTYHELKKLEREEVIKRSAYNKWATNETIKAIAFFWRDRAEKSNATNEKTRILKAKAAQEEMKVGLMSGELGYVSEITQAYHDEVINIRTELESILPRSLSLLSNIPSAREKEIVYRNEVRKVLESISNDTTRSSAPSKRVGKGSIKKNATAPKKRIVR